MRRLNVLFLAGLLGSGAVWIGACSGGSGKVTTTSGSGGASSSASVTSTSNASSGSSVATAGSGLAGSTAAGFGGSPIVLAAPPDAGPPQAADGTTNVTFAITKLYLGDTDRDGTPDATNGWTHFGYNIDGLQPSYIQGFCNPVAGASLSTLRATGDNGIENAWGHLVLPLLLAFAPTLSTTTNQSLAAGDFTSLMVLNDLGVSTSDNPLGGQITPGASLGHAPKLDGTDAWPSFIDFSLALPQSYLVNDTWVSTTVTAVPLYLPTIPGFGAVGQGPGVRLRKLTISMQLDAAHHTATNGIISGVITTADLTAALEGQLGALGPSFCPPSTALANLLSQVQAASDIMHDGTQDPLATCDGITIGIGFDASWVQLGAPEPFVAPAAACPDAGTQVGPDGGTNDAGGSMVDGGSDAGTTGDDGGANDGGANDGGDGG